VWAFILIIKSLHIVLIYRLPLFDRKKKRREAVRLIAYLGKNGSGKPM
jgi:hypothetical protein